MVTPSPSANNLIDLQIGKERLQRPLLEAGSDAKPVVALVRPPLMFHERSIGNEIVPSIGLAYINGYLRKFGYEPFLIDGQSGGHNRITPLINYPGYQIQGLTFEELFEQIPEGVDIFGITAMFSAEWPLARDLINAIKKKNPNAIIVAGGEHISAAAEESLQDCEGLDICARGEGEHVFLEVCEAIQQDLPLSQVPGIVFRNDKNELERTTAVTRIRNIDEIPWPHWPDGYLEKFWASGKSFGVQSARDMPLMMTRGCPYQCTFCSNKDMWTTRYVMRDVDDVIDEVKFYYEKYAVTSFQIYDLTAITKRKWFIEFLIKIDELNLPVEWSFPSGTRSEVLDDEILGLLKKVGTSYMCLAPESGSERTLKEIKKQIKLDGVIEVIKGATKADLTTRVNLVIGFPNETRSDVYKTLWLALRCSVHGVEDLQPYLFNPYPGSELFSEAKESGKIVLDDEYYLTISYQNSNLFNFKPMTFNQNIPPWELAFYRLSMTAVCYGLSYLLHPSRIVRTIRNVRSENRAATVFEARIKGIFSRKKALSN